jgi:hypothetical protein
LTPWLAHHTKILLVRTTYPGSNFQGHSLLQPQAFGDVLHYGPWHG